MKKTQKKLGNKGFSLVELIVVIAIMAVLVGVLAPTLIRNVEKSRESTDLQNLDSIRQSVVTAMSTESVAGLTPTTGTSSIVYSSLAADASGASSTLTGALYDEMKDDNTLGVNMKSKAAKTGTIKILIDSTGKVSVGVYKTSGSTESVVDCNRTKGAKFISE